MFGTNWNETLQPMMEVKVSNKLEPFRDHLCLLQFPLHLYSSLQKLLIVDHWMNQLYCLCKKVIVIKWELIHTRNNTAGLS